MTSGAAAPAQDGDANIIVSCARDADEDIVGLTELDAECPGLEPALVDAGLAPFISEAQSAALTSAALSDLAQLREHYRQLPALHTLSIDQVAQVARELEQVKAARPLTWRERLSQWVRQFFDRPQSNGSSWLAEWLRNKSLPQKVTDVIVTGLILLVIVLALIVLINELRAAGVFRKRAARKAAGLGSNGMPGSTMPLTFADISAAPLRDQPSLLLQLVVNALVDTGRLQAARSLTHRELALRARFDASLQREQFSLLATGAERARYGRDLPTATQIEALLTDGRALHAQIAATPAERSGDSA